MYTPIAALLHKVGKDVDSLQRLLTEEEERKRRSQKKPAHALLPEDENDDELPVHSDEGWVKSNDS